MAIAYYRVKWYDKDRKAHYSQPSNLTDTRRKACTHIDNRSLHKNMVVIERSYSDSPKWHEFGMVFRQTGLRIYKADDEKQSYIIDSKTGKIIGKWL